MSRHILFCKGCDIYTLEEACPKCKSKTLSTKPAKFSPEDKWGKYRRIAKAESL